MEKRLVPDVSCDRAAPDDIEEICAIENLSFSVPWSRQMMMEEIRGDSFSHFLVARDNHTRRVVGYVSFLVVFDELHLMNLAVHPGWRRQGIGGDLVRHALKVGGEQGARRAMLEVRASNEVARKLYEKLGFRLIAIRKDYYSHPREDALILRLDTL